MATLAHRDNPSFSFAVADVRALPVAAAALDGVVAWYSLMYLGPDQRTRAFAELGRVVRPGGYFVSAFKIGDNQPRRSGQTLVQGVAYDVYWHSADEVQDRVVQAGFQVALVAQRPADPDEAQPQGYLLARRD